MNSLVIVRFFFLGLLPIAYGIKCWDCQSDIDIGCQDPFQNATLVLNNCPDVSSNDYKIAPTLCLRSRKKVDGTWQYTSRCAYAPEAREEVNDRICVTRTDSKNVITEDCFCNDRDACNNTSIKSISPVFVFIALLIGTLRIGKI